MSEIAWEALMRLGLTELQLPPDTFWNLTPLELMTMSGQARPGASVLDRQAMEDLMLRFPDDTKDE